MQSRVLFCILTYATICLLRPCRPVPLQLFQRERAAHHPETTIHGSLRPADSRRYQRAGSGRRHRTGKGTRRQHPARLRMYQGGSPSNGRQAQCRSGIMEADPERGRQENRETEVGQESASTARVLRSPNLSHYSCRHPLSATVPESRINVILRHHQNHSYPEVERAAHVVFRYFADPLNERE